MVHEEIISLTEFKSNASGWIKKLESQPPVILTQNGRGVAVVQSYEAYQQMRSGMALMARIRQAEADLRAGRTTPQDEVFARARERLKQRLKKDD